MKKLLNLLKSLFRIVFGPIFCRVATVFVPVQPRFVARNHFKVDTSDSAVVRIAFICGTFTHFLEKVEGPVAEMALAIHALIKNVLDKEILARLERKEETTLSQLWAVLERQGCGQAGELLTDGYANVFYIRDANSVLWAVSAQWHIGFRGWLLYASPINSLRGWLAGNQVFSQLTLTRL